MILVISHVVMVQGDSWKTGTGRKWAMHSLYLESRLGTAMLKWEIAGMRGSF